MDGRLNLPAVQEVLMTTLQSFEAGSLSPKEALRRIRRWLNSGQTQEVDAEFIREYQLA
jgi:hypothetical protein